MACLSLTFPPTGKTQTDQSPWVLGSKPGPGGAPPGAHPPPAWFCCSGALSFPSILSYQTCSLSPWLHCLTQLPWVVWLPHRLKLREHFPNVQPETSTSCAQGYPSHIATPFTPAVSPSHHTRLCPAERTHGPSGFPKAYWKGSFRVTLPGHHSLLAISDSSCGPSAK